MKLKEKWQALVAREKEKTKNMTFKQKVEYVAENWWAEIVAVLVAIALLFGAGYMIVNACKDHILYFGIVDASLTEEECQTISADFKAYLGNTKKLDVVTIDSQISSLGALDMETTSVPEAMDHQQKSMILIGTGLLDAYICPQRYVEYLKSYDDLDTVENIIGAELAGKYAEFITEDGYAMELSAEKAAMFGVEYEPCYLVFTYNNHFPEVTMAFAQYLFEE